MGGQIKRRSRPFGVLGVQRFYEELPLGPKIMVSHPTRYWNPPTDIFECDKAFVIKVALSGLQRSPDGELRDVEVIVEDDTVVIRGDRKDRCDHDRCRFIQMEIYYGRFESRVRFGTPVDPEAIQAEYHDGFLEVIVPKAGRKPERTRRIKIQP